MPDVNRCSRWTTSTIRLQYATKYNNFDSSHFKYGRLLKNHLEYSEFKS